MNLDHVEGQTNDQSSDGGSRPSSGVKKVAKSIAVKAAKIPTQAFLWAAGGAVIASAVTQMMQPRRTTWFNLPTRRGQLGLFIGQWAPTLILLGVVSRMAKRSREMRGS